MYEQCGERPVSTAEFVWRLAKHVGLASLVMLASLGAGMVGYAHYEHLGWLDAFLNASMLLGGMGPVHNPATPGGKLFAGLYALYSGMVFLIVAGIVFTPVVHRLMHHFHWDDEND